MYKILNRPPHFVPINPLKQQTFIVFISYSLSCVWLLSDRQEPARLLCPWDFPCKNTGVGCHALLQGVFPTEVSNLCLRHWQMDSLPLSLLESPGRGLGGEKRELRQHRENSGRKPLTCPTCERCRTKSCLSQKPGTRGLSEDCTWQQVLIFFCLQEQLTCYS